MATTSQKMMDMRFFVRIRGALTPPPRIEEPEMKMPLCGGFRQHQYYIRAGVAREGDGWAIHTMLLRPQTTLCTVIFPCSPTRWGISIRGNFRRRRPRRCRRRAYLGFPCEKLRASSCKSDRESKLTCAHHSKGGPCTSQPV